MSHCLHDYTVIPSHHYNSLTQIIIAKLKKRFLSNNSFLPVNEETIGIMNIPTHFNSCLTLRNLFQLIPV